MRFVLKAVAVGRAAAVAVALVRVLGLAAAHLATELLDLELVESLEHVSDQAALGRHLVTGGERVEDLHSCTGKLTLVGEGAEQVAAQAGGGVDHNGVEAPGVAVLGLTHELAPAGAVIAAAGVLVGEVAHDPTIQLRGLGFACLPLGRERERRVLLVLGRQAPVPRKPSHHWLPAWSVRRRLVASVSWWEESRSSSARVCSRRSCSSSVDPAGICSIDTLTSGSSRGVLPSSPMKRRCGS
jgi:hypothetical protein